MTLLNTNAPAAGTPPTGGAPANPATATPPSSGGEAPKQGEQTAAGKEPSNPANKADTTETGKGDIGGAKPEGEKPPAPPTPFRYKPSPDGFEMGEETATALTDVARELNLSNEAAQQIVDKMAPALSAQTQKNIKAMIDGWENDSRAAFGDKLTEEISYAH